MNHRLIASFRVLCRSVWLAAEVLAALINFVGLSVTSRRLPDQAARARWLQRACRRALRVLHVTLSVAGPLPSRGLLVCNHLSYLDILILSAATPCTFVSKCEVRSWPVFGWFAFLAGTLFVRRDKRSDVLRVARKMRHIMDNGGLVVLFPEGTTSDGRQVLPFKTSLLQVAHGRPCILNAGSISYALDDGNVEEEVCYWKDMTLLPHLLNLFTKRRVTAEIRFAALSFQTTDRKELARQLHSEVIRLKESNFRARPSSSFHGGTSQIENSNQSLIDASL